MEIKYELLEKELNHGKLHFLYLFYGNEKYLMDTAIKKIKKAFGELILGINFVIIDETNLKDLVYNLEVPAFGYEKKLILVKSSGLFKKDGRKKEMTPFQKEVRTYLQENISMLKDSNVIVFLEEEIDKNDVYEVISQNGVICQMDELKPPALIAKLKQVCQLYQVTAEEATLQYLLETSGTNLQILMNEIRKLIEYAGSGGKITKTAIDELATKQMESVIFDLTDHLGSKKVAAAMQVLDQLVYQKEPLQKILVSLYNHFKKLYFCAIALEQNQDIGRALNLKPNQTFLISKYKKQTSYFKKENLRQLLKEFVEIDYKSKNGLIDIDIALKSVLCHYCS